jgi:hypothetical protein
VRTKKFLQGLLHDLDAGGGALRNTTAFLSEKLARIKLLLEDPAGTQLAPLEKLEALALGIEGKRALWRALLAIAEIPALRKVDLARLINALTTSTSASKLAESRLRDKPLCLQSPVADSA